MVLIVKKVIKYLKNPKLIIIYLMNKNFFFFLSDKLFLKWKFKILMGYKLDLNNPQTFNEKLQWLKLYNRKPIYTKMVDKYEAKEYVKNIIGEEYIIHLKKLILKNYLINLLLNLHILLVMYIYVLINLILIIKN